MAVGETARGAGRRSGSAVLDGLLARIAGGDAAAFTSFYDQVSGAVYGLVRRIISDQPRADEVAAEVLVEVWRSAAQFDPAKQSGLSWVMTMARRYALRQAGTGDAGRLARLAPAGVVPAPLAATLAAHRGLASLPEPQREAVLLAYCGRTPQEMADLAGASAATMAERLRGGLRELSSRPEALDTRLACR
jgi:RNA polymerase sigma-70 factor, ECF subfamily